MIVDVRLILGREGAWLVRVEGRPVPRIEATTAQDALDELARAIEGAAWLSGRSALEELQDPHGALFEAFKATPGSNSVGGSNT